MNAQKKETKAQRDKRLLAEIHEQQEVDSDFFGIVVNAALCVVVVFVGFCLGDFLAGIVNELF